eukprot:714433-Rhodomonas_salina.1
MATLQMPDPLFRAFADLRRHKYRHGDKFFCSPVLCTARGPDSRIHGTIPKPGTLCGNIRRSNFDGYPCTRVPGYAGTDEQQRCCCRPGRNSVD